MTRSIDTIAVSMMKVDEVGMKTRKRFKRL
jgi:hypothetical protein